MANVFEILLVQGKQKGVVQTLSNLEDANERKAELEKKYAGKFIVEEIGISK